MNLLSNKLRASSVYHLVEDGRRYSALGEQEDPCSCSLHPKEWKYRLLTAVYQYRQLISQGHGLFFVFCRALHLPASTHYVIVAEPFFILNWMLPQDTTVYFPKRYHVFLDFESHRVAFGFEYFYALLWA
jgi:hypothetical protein